MSGKGKRICYHICDILLFFAAMAAVILITVSTVPKPVPEWGDVLASIAFGIAILLKLPEFIHEIGHFLFGTMAGMKLVSFRVFLFKGKTAGATVMIPKSAKHVRGKFEFFLLGGAIFNFLAGGVLYSVYFLFPYHSALLFCEFLAPFMIYEGVRALIPAELPAGKTDGAVFKGLVKKNSEEEILLRVVTAQGILLKKTFSNVPKDLLFTTPVVREDLPAFHALLFLQMQYLFAENDDLAAQENLRRLIGLEEYLEEEQREEIRRYELIFHGEFYRKKQLLFGVDDLEKKLESRNDST